jgi:hypothetical protein
MPLVLIESQVRKCPDLEAKMRDKRDTSQAHKKQDGQVNGSSGHNFVVIVVN